MLLFTINLKNLIPGPFSSIPNTKNPKKEFVSIFVKNPSLRFFKKKIFEPFLSLYAAVTSCKKLEKFQGLKEINRLISKGMSNFHLNSSC